jgi:hypothetical protein
MDFPSDLMRIHPVDHCVPLFPKAVAYKEK